MLTCEINDLLAYLPLAQITTALDDDGDGVLDETVWQAVVAQASRRILDIFNADRVPDKFAAACQSALVLLVASALYTRRGFYGAANPVADDVTAALERLRRLAASEEATPVAPDKTTAVITSNARLTNCPHLLL